MLRDDLETRASRPHVTGTAGKMPALPGALRELEARRGASNENAMRVASEMIAGVRARGDAFVREQVERFDGIAVDDLLVTPRNVSIDEAMRDAIEVAIERIEAFHRPQLPQSYRWNAIEHRVRPLRRVAIYVPGGRAVYLSTLIMCAVPARIAGVRELVVITTPFAASRDELHYACSRLGITAIYRCGGAAGIAERLENCGAIFCGPFSPVAAGDYVAGANHVLPTGGSARFFSPLGVYDFVKRSNVISLTAEELAEISEAGERIAAFEGLPKHAASIAVRRTYVA